MVRSKRKSTYIIGIDEVGRAALKRRASPHSYVVGIDEVGRGALAGSVTVAAVAARVNSKFKIQNSKLKLRDSKKLSPRQRETWFKWIKQHSDILENVGMFYATASVSPKIIDKINISNAANLAATRALKKLLNNTAIALLLSKKQKVKIFLDGGLYLNTKKPRNKKNIRVNPCLPARFAGASARRAGRRVSNPHISASTITKGDEKIPAIMLASIVAKVTRDRMMVKLHKKYPKYNFDRHKGYGTKKHIKAIRKHGPTKVHRLAFLKKIH